MTESAESSASEYCEEKFVIAVSGLPGSGKSTLAKLLAKELRLRYVSSGALFRRLAKERGMTLLEFTKLAEKDYSIDRMIDNEARKEAKKGCVVVDGHIAGWILKDLAHVKVYLYAPREVRVSRIAARDGKSLEDALKEVIERDRSESKRFKEIYGIDVNDLTVFDICINTATFGIEETLRITLEAVREVARKKLKDRAHKQG